MKTQRKRETVTGKTIDKVENISKHATSLLERIPKNITSKKAKKKALGNIIRAEYSVAILKPENFKPVGNVSKKSDTIPGKTVDSVNESYSMTRMMEIKHPVKNSDIRGIEKAKLIAEAVYNDRITTYSKSSNSSKHTSLRKGKKVLPNGIRFTEKEINDAQTKYKHIYDREIQKLEQRDILNDADGEHMLIKKLYERLSLELNKQKYQHKRDS